MIEQKIKSTDAEQKQKKLEDSLLTFVERVCNRETTSETEVEVMPAVAQVLSNLLKP